MGEANKEQHYVPRTLLKRWCIDRGNRNKLVSLNLKSERILEQEIDKICKKKNFYTLPSTYEITNKENKKLIDNIVSSTFESRFNDVFERLLIRGNYIGEDIKNLINFIYIQSIRTLKYKIETEKLLKAEGDTKVLVHPFSIHFSALMIGGLPKFVSNASIEIFRAPISKRFVCSDNPASFWVIEKGIYKNIKTLTKNEDILLNDTFFVVCPLSPYHLGVVYPNIGIEKKQRVFHDNTTPLLEREVIMVNKFIEFAAYKQIYAKYTSDFESTYSETSIAINEFNKLHFTEHINRISTFTISFD